MKFSCFNKPPELIIFWTAPFHCILCFQFTFLDIFHIRHWFSQLSFSIILLMYSQSLSPLYLPIHCPWLNFFSTFTNYFKLFKYICPDQMHKLLALFALQPNSIMLQNYFPNIKHILCQFSAQRHHWWLLTETILFLACQTFTIVSLPCIHLSILLHNAHSYTHTHSNTHP